MLIFDRTLTDVDRAKELIGKGYANLSIAEKQEYDNGIKGTYSYRDINRVNEEVNAIAKELNDDGYHNNIKAKTDWKANAIWEKKDVEDYIKSVANLVHIYYNVGIDVPNNINIYTKCNDIEEILHNLKLTINDMKKSYRYLGTFSLGQDYNF